jgi:putative two-component system response regulator
MNIVASADRPIRILLLEDSADDAELIQRQLRQSGLAFTAERVETRAAFAQALERFGPHVVICDYKLPGFDGRSALRLVNQQPVRPPVIVVSGALTDEEAVDLVKAGAADFVLKDRLARLGSAVQRAVAEAEGALARRAAEAAVRRERALAERERQIHEESIRRSLEESIHAVARAVEKRDPYTAGHQCRVAHLAGVIGRELGLPADRVRGLEFAAGIHDLGKIAVPAEILSKPGRLTRPEYELVKHHAQAGYEILQDVRFVWPVAQMIRQHHERLDGSGYPCGLMGDRILPEAKIIAVADVVEAMAGRRPYRAALGIEAALMEISRGRGAQYDAAAADACLRLFREKDYHLPPTEPASCPAMR